MLSATFSQAVGHADEVFQPEVQIADDPRNSPCVYAPTIIIAEEYDVPMEHVMKAWETYEKSFSPTEKAETSGHTLITYVQLSEGEQNAPIEDRITYTIPLRLIRYGVQIIKVFGPDSYMSYKDACEGGDSFEQEVNVVESIVPLHQLNMPLSALYKDVYSSTEKAQDDSIFDDKPLFCQSTAAHCLCRYDVDFFGNRLEKRYFLPGNASQHTEKQVKSLGRRNKVVRELLRFQGSTEQTIQYWWNPEVNVKIVEKTIFTDKTGRKLRKDEIPTNRNKNKSSDADEWARGYIGTKGVTFRSANPCWGMMVVEYVTQYSEFQLLYDFPNPQRTIRVSVGSVEKVGYEVHGKDADNIKEFGTSLPPSTVGERDGVFCRHVRLAKNAENKWEPVIPLEDVTDSTSPQCAVRVMKKVEELEFEVTGIELMYTNGVAMVSSTFMPPKPNFSPSPAEEVPKIVIWESRRRRTVGGATVDIVEAIKYMDVLGNITEEKFEEKE